MMGNFGGFMAFGFLLYLAVIVFFFWLLWDFVGSHRRIASALEILASKYKEKE